MAFSKQTKESALLASQRSCCVCHKFCGTKIELHHMRLDSEGGDDSLENCIPLCFDCHADMTSYDFKHPKGNRYGALELKRHRDNWFARVGSGSTTRVVIEYVAFDKKIAEESKAILPWDGNIQFLRRHDFGGSFERSDLLQLKNFMSRCEDKSFEFFSSDIELLRVGLLFAIKLLLEMVIENLETAGENTQRLRIPLHLSLYEVSKSYEISSKLNKLAESVCSNYDDLNVAIRRQLAV